MKVTLQILPKIGCHGKVPKGIKKEVRIEKNHANTFHLVLDPEIICLKLKKKKLRKVKYIARSAS